MTDLTQGSLRRHVWTMALPMMIGMFVQSLYLFVDLYFVADLGAEAIAAVSAAGNLMLLIINLPLIGIWIKLLTVPYRLLFPAILTFCCIGLYTLNNNNFDVFMTAIFAVIGYAFYKLGCEPAPLLLGFILGPMMEENLRRALLLSRGDWSVFVTRPLSAGLLAAAALLLIIVLLPSVKSKREEAFVED